MAQFQYTAVNSTGKKLSGVIGALSEDEARKQLNTFGIALLNIQKIAETPVQSATHEPATTKELPKYEFEAYDKTSKKVLGTIPASSRYKAFKRLMEEYQFEVAYVVPLGSSEEEKAKAKREDLSALKAEYDAQNKIMNTTEREEQKISAQFDEKRKNLLEKVDFILEKIRGLLAKYQDELNPELRKLVQNYVDKLLRIKSSTNLDYIENTSEELLKKVQDQELFLHKEKMGKDRAQFKLEAQKLMATLHSGPGATGLTQNLEALQDRFKGSENPWLKGLASWLSQFVPTEEEKMLREKISTVKRDIWTYRKIVWKSPGSTKDEARQSLQTLVEEKKRLQQNLKDLIHARRHEDDSHELSEPLITEEISHFLGWLLAFYLVAYFLSYYFSAKMLPGGNPLPGDFNLLNSELLRHLLLSVFLWHVLLILRLHYLRYKEWANLAVIPLGIVLNAGLVFNL